ncbi:hypothetical protein [Actinoplanes sp. NBRC 103695]|uniref:hypothetical protein n=1 Tax=Actinoplanes sp. NBRC 103695 TaxID=3032202 RepID=UPI0024A56549|nr:hypothetical protein [Actinoplanes sp. NBRC 103695]GLY99559.1 hypothetical protein Acsp02_68120 [Actinoplanes sp. NBRC 103695]
MALTDAARMLVATVLGLRPPSRFPLRDLDVSDPAITVVNDAELFQPKDFDPVELHWTEDNDPAATPVFKAMGLGLHWTARAGRGIEVLAPATGPMICDPRTENGELIEQRLTINLSGEDLKRLREGPTPNGDAFDVGAARLILVMGPGLAASLTERMREHHAARRLRPVPPGAAGAADQLDRWLAGDDSVPWRFTDGVGPRDAGLGELSDLETLVLHAEVSEQKADGPLALWYRINPGLVLDRLRRADDGMQAGYTLIISDYAARGVASGGAVNARSELCVVRGGSLNSVVLQPRGVVPAALFSFVTSDPIQVFAPAVDDPPERSLTVFTAQPTITRAALQLLWNKYGIKHQLNTGPAEPEEFPVIDYPLRVVLPDKVSADRPWAFYDDLATEIAYGATGWRFASLAGAGVERTLIPQADPRSRPFHPQWTKARSMLPRRLYPLRLTVLVGPDFVSGPQFTVTQDERDCIRQEYVFHMCFVEPYFQDYRERWPDPEERARNVHPAPTARPHEIEILGGKPVRPALGAGGMIRIPRRGDLRPATDRRTAYRHTLLTRRSDGLFAEAQAAAATYALEIFGVVQALMKDDFPPQVSLPAYARDAVIKIVRLWRGVPLPTSTTDGFLQAMIFALNAVKQFAELDASGTATMKPYRLYMSSGWRPPEHNETVSSTPLSNHQIGEAMDLQPLGAGSAATRNPLAILALHLAAQDFAKGAPAVRRLRECLLELERGEYLVGQVEEEKVSRVVVERIGPGGSRRFVLSRAGFPDEEFPHFPSLDGEPITGGTPLDLQLVQEFRTAFNKMNQKNPAPWPLPTYLDVYIFGLCSGSHVHHTWNIAE